MKLMTKELEKKFPNLKETDGQGMGAKVVAKFFFPVGSATWFATEYDSEQKLFFGYASMFPGSGELGYFSLAELESVVGPMGLKIERDLYFEEKTLEEAVSGL